MWTPASATVCGCSSRRSARSLVLCWARSDQRWYGDEVNRLRREAFQAIREQRLMDAFKTLSRLFEAKGWFWDACNGGRLAYRLGKLPEAHRLLSACDELAEKADQRKLDIRDKRILKESRNDLALVRTQVARLTIYVNKPGAELFVDGSKIGVSPFHKEIGLEPGAHRVKAVLGDVSVEREYKIGAGELRIADLALHDPPPFETPRASSKTGPAKTEATKSEPAKTGQTRETAAAAGSSCGRCSSPRVAELDDLGRGRRGSCRSFVHGRRLHHGAE